MESPQSFDFKQYGIDIGLLVSGLFGSILLTSKTGAFNLPRTLSCLIAGAASANYITPVIINLTKLDESHYHYSIAFILGFLGLKGVEFFTGRILPEVEEEIKREIKLANKPRRRRIHK